jgi:HK97 gp10 family phage protein
MDMTFDFSSVNRMAAAYKGGQQIVLQETRQGITRAVIQIEADAKREVPTDTHTLQRSIAHEVTTAGRDVTGRVGSNLHYAPVVEYGRSPGRMPPPGALAGWLRRKGIDERYAFVVARSIARRGIRPRPYLKPALAKNRQKISREMDNVLRRIATRLAATR